MASIYEAFTQGRQNGEARRTKRTLSQHLQGALSGDQAALSQVYAADPSSGIQAQKMASQQEDEDMADVAKAATFYSQTRDPKAYAYIRQRVSRFPQFAGLPETLDTPEDQEGAVKFTQALAQTYGGQAKGGGLKNLRIGGDGYYYAVQGNQFVNTGIKADSRTKVVEGENGFNIIDERAGVSNPVMQGGGPFSPSQQGQPVIRESSGRQVNLAPDLSPEDRAAIMANPDAYAQVPDGGSIQLPPIDRSAIRPPQQGQQLRPAPKTISPAEERRLQLAEEDNARADREEQRKIRAGAVAGKPPNDGERAAFGYLGRMQAAEKLLSDIESKGYEPGGYIDTTAANNAGMPVLGPLFNAATSPQGQQYRQAQEDWVRAKLRKESGAVIGDDEMAREIRVYFPQPGDGPDVIAQKSASRLQAEQQLKSMAGRAAPAGNSQPAGTQRQIKRTGRTKDGRRVIEYTDGTREYE